MADVTCSVDDRPISGPVRRGMCDTHYRRALRCGEIARRPILTPAERLTTGLVRMPNGCLEWTGGTNDAGYGQISVNNKTVTTHRLAWTLAKGTIPPGLDVLHRCDNPPCCDADKCLFLGTQADNAADMVAKGRRYDNMTPKTHCPQNHRYDETNTYVNPQGSRECRICTRDAGARYRRRKCEASR